MTALEHNSVIRPLRHLESTGTVTISVAPCDKMGFLDLQALKGLVRPETALMGANHASNVCGTIQDVAAVQRLSVRCLC